MLKKCFCLQANVNKSEDFFVREKPNLVYGGIRGDFIHASKTESFLLGKCLNKIETLQGACQLLEEEVDPAVELVTSSPVFRKHLTQALLYKVMSSVSPNLSHLEKLHIYRRTFSSITLIVHNWY